MGDRVGETVGTATDMPPGELDQYAEAVLRAGDGAYLWGESVLALHGGLADVNPAQVTVAVTRRTRSKLHAASCPGSDRARDLVDLQLLDAGEGLDLGAVAATCERLLIYRQQQQQWPPNLIVGEGWEDLYAAAAEGLDVLASASEAVEWVNGFVKRIAYAAIDHGK